MNYLENIINPFIKMARVVAFTAVVIGIASCKKMVELDPPSQSILQENVFITDPTAISALTGIYVELSSNTGMGNFTGSGGISVLGGLSADELTLHSGVTAPTINDFYRNNFEASGASGQAGTQFWSILYKYLYRCNAAIEGLSTPASEANLTPAVRTQLLGEAYFMRAFFFFYLVNLYGEVPLTITTDYKVNTLLAKSSTVEVNKLIVKDLLLAKEYLSEKFLDITLLGETTERVRPTKWAAAALLARVYLYTGQNEKAEIESSAIISNLSNFELLPLATAFQKNSKEAIWQLQPTSAGRHTQDGATFIIPPAGPTNSSTAVPLNPVYLSTQLLNAFETGDSRAIMGNWIDSTIYRVTVSPLNYDTVYFPFKYKRGLDPAVSGTGGAASMMEYLMVLRLGEQYLIRAEARVRQNNISGARQDLIAIRSRAGLLPGTLTANDQPSLLDAVLHERQVELFTEWGHRWFDLKRFGKIDQVMGVVAPLKGGFWESYKINFPIPFSDLQRNPNLTQNVGY